MRRLACCVRERRTCARRVRARVECSRYRHTWRRQFHAFDTVVDLCPSDSNPPARVASSLGRALRDTGFAYVKSPFFSAAHLHSLLAVSREYFASPREQKEKCAATDGREGFHRFECASGWMDDVEAFTVGSATMPDDQGWSPSIRLEARQSYFHASDPSSNGYLRHEPQVNWAVTPRLFREALQRHFHSAHHTAIAVFDALSLHLNVPVETLRRAHRSRDHTLEVKYYPKHSAERKDNHQSAHIQTIARAGGSLHIPRSHTPWGDGSGGRVFASAPNAKTESGSEHESLVRFSEHCDLSTLTFLAQSHADGLEIWHEGSQEWLRAPAREDAVLMNVGDFLSDWTGGLLPSTPHRVVSLPDDSASDTTVEQAGRISVVTFVQPDWDTLVQPLTGMQTVFEPYHAGDRMPLLL